MDKTCKWKPTIIDIYTRAECIKTDKEPITFEKITFKFCPYCGGEIVEDKNEK